jgi:molybdenum cofactor cytidylyltransferase
LRSSRRLRCGSGEGRRPGREIRACPAEGGARRDHGAFGAHARAPGQERNGRRPADIAALEAAKVEAVVVARPEADDIGENEAAAALAQAIAGDKVRIEDAFTGRANLYSETGGVLMVDRAAVDRFNRVNEAVTLATLPEYRPVQEGEMIATVKIITFAIPRAVHEAALAAASRVISVAPYRIKRVAVVSTQLPGLAPKVIDKTVRVTAERLKPAGAEIVADLRVPHEPAKLQAAIGQALGSREPSLSSCSALRPSPTGAM